MALFFTRTGGADAVSDFCSILYSYNTPAKTVYFPFAAQTIMLCVLRVIPT